VSRDTIHLFHDFMRYILPYHSVTSGGVFLEIDGVIRRELTVHGDARGELTEYFRVDWKGMPELVQWHYFRSQPNVLRGVHAHAQHLDYSLLLEGRLLLGLHDLRPASSSYGRST
jgi:dTDP-4-dehydrorhamnose 3,5-epimerase